MEQPPMGPTAKDAAIARVARDIAAMTALARRWATPTVPGTIDSPATTASDLPGDPFSEESAERKWCELMREAQAQEYAERAAAERVAEQERADAHQAGILIMRVIVALRDEKRRRAPDDGPFVDTTAYPTPEPPPVLPAPPEDAGRLPPRRRRGWGWDRIRGFFLPKKED